MPDHIRHNARVGEALPDVSDLIICSSDHVTLLPGRVIAFPSRRRSARHGLRRCKVLSDDVLTELPGNRYSMDWQYLRDELSLHRDVLRAHAVFIGTVADLLKQKVQEWPTAEHSARSNLGRLFNTLTRDGRAENERRNADQAQIAVFKDATLPGLPRIS